MVARRAPASTCGVSSVPESSDITLQINLCAGDLSYGERTVAALIATHRADVREVVVVADGCRPHSTPLLDADTQFPAAEFAARVERLRMWCAALPSSGNVDRVVWLQPEPAALRTLNAKYCGVTTARSHDHLGHAFSAYFLGWESARTRYVAHFDADIVLWQEPGFHWLRAAIAALEADPTLLAASPRIAPPPMTDAMVHVDAPGSGWLPSWPLERRHGGWRSPWFSTRCHLIDRERLMAALPLQPARGAAADRRASTLDRLLAPIYDAGFAAGKLGRIARSIARRIPPFPLPPEVLLHEHAQAHGFGCVYLDDPRAWFVHPDTKPETFLRLLPRLLTSVAERGEYPAQQRGLSGVQFGAWESFLPGSG
jgi:hypothetical protein